MHVNIYSDLDSATTLDLQHVRGTRTMTGSNTGRDSESNHISLMML